MSGLRQRMLRQKDEPFQKKANTTALQVTQGNTSASFQIESKHVTNQKMSPRFPIQTESWHL